MREVKITANDAGRRLDRFLRKYLREASLSEIYKFIRKDVKVDGKRRNESYILNEGEVLALYISDDNLKRLSGGRFSFNPSQSDHGDASVTIGSSANAKRNFDLVYEDDQILIANKPYGLLTHGDSYEKKDHLANRVKDYLIASGAYDPREKVFTPAPVNRLDRNTTGLVLFGKTSSAMRELTRIIRENKISKYYLTMACGIIEDELHLTGSLVKDRAVNKVKIISETEDPTAKHIETIVLPLEYCEFGDGLSATLCAVELVTGRSHQIRAHLADAGHPLIGDSKYAGRIGARINTYCRSKCGVSTQLLHSYRVEFSESIAEYDSIGYLAGLSFKSPMPSRFCEVFWKLYQ